MVTVPEAFIQNPKVRKILLNGQNCMVQKFAYEPNPDNERYISTNALTFVESGQLLINTEEETFAVRRGEFVFLPSGLYLLTDILSNNEPFSATVVFFDKHLARQSLANIEVVNRVQTNPLVMGPDPKIFEQVRSIKQKFHKLTEQAAAKWNILQLLNLILANDQTGQFGSMLSKSLDRQKMVLSHFMEMHFSKNLKIEDFARLTGRSTSTFQRDFKREFGQAPKSWLLSKRMIRAKETLLSNTRLTISELAWSNGYENVSHFIKNFRDFHGITPKQYQLSQE